MAPSAPRLPFFDTLRLIAEPADDRLYAVESRDAPQR